MRLIRVVKIEKDFECMRLKILVITIFRHATQLI